MTGTQKKQIHGTILYDGGCGMCTTFVARREGWFLRHGFAIAPLQEEGISKRYGITEAQLLEAIHCVTPEGGIIRGADVYRFVFSKIWYLKPIALLSKIPGFSFIFDATYRWVAVRRRKISAACGWKGSYTK